MSSELTYTPIGEITKICKCVRGLFRAGKDNVKYLQDALRKDLGRPVLETNLCDISGIIADALFTYKHIDSWVKPEKSPFDVNWFPFSPKMHKEPKGTVLIICPFNYPIGTLAPITGAIAAGCAVVAKPSELTPATSQLLAELFPKYLDQDLYRILNGSVEETTKLLSLQWDHILYTGSGRVGCIVATAAAKYLTPTTLELGGKSPVIVDETADLELTARRILWGRTVNSGQTCIAPEYVLVPQRIQGRLVDALKTEWKRFYGEDPRTSGSTSRLCSPSHWERVAGLLQETQGDVVIGGQTDRSDKYIAPTIVQDVAFGDPLMREEVFGPILAIVPVSDIDTALNYINNHDHPLALYVFSKDSKLRAYVREHTLSGMFVENDVVIHGGCPVMPFGGVGASGYGSHRGKYSFDMFTHYRASYNSPRWIDLILSVRYPPYTEKSLKKTNAALMAPIPYPRPGDSKQFNWKRWVMLAITFGLIAANKQRIYGLIKS